MAEFCRAKQTVSDRTRPTVYCTRPKGHVGNHIATVGTYNPNSEILAEWGPMCAICGDPDGEMHNVTLADTPSKHPTHRFTTVKPKFWTAANVHEWISIHVNLNEGCHETPEAAALWWLAVEYAGSVGEMNTRERASMFIDGIVPLCEQDITDKVQNMHEDQEDADEQIEADLKSFFNESR